MTQGRFEEACPKFEASQQLDPASGTLLNLADCLEREGRTASAWARFLEAASAAGRAGSAKREAVARERASRLEPILSRVRFAVQGEQEGLSLRLDGSLLPPASWDMAMPVDPGVHALVASAPGFQPREESFEVRAGAGETLLPIAPLLPAAAEPDSPARADRPAEPTPAEIEAARAARFRKRKRTGWVVGGVGIASLATGGALAIVAKQRWDSAACTDSPYGGKECEGNNQQTAATAQRLAHTSTGMFIGGSILTAAGLMLALMSRTPDGDTDTDTGSSASLRFQPGFSRHGAFLSMHGEL